MRLLSASLSFALALGLVGQLLPAAAAEITVPDAAAFRAAIRQLPPGTVLRLAPGQYGSGHHLQNVRGTAEQPVVIEAADTNRPPVFSGGSVALQLSGCAYLTLRHLRLEKQSGNGLNVDDGGARGGSSHHLTLEDLHVTETGPRGNTDGIKLSGIEDFVVRRCRIIGWGGQAVDRVGCRRGVIEQCHFEGRPGFSQATGPQAKGGSEDIVVRACTFLRAGERPMHVGGSTGRPYFRPPDAKFEARRITVEGCLFVGGMAPVVFTGSQDGVFRYNTVVNPEVWAFRVLQENTEPGMLPCGRHVFTRNLMVVDQGALRTWVNVGGGTAAGSMQFSDNWWFHRSPAQPARPALPSAETNGRYGTDPQLDPARQYAPRLPAAQGYGHTAWRRP